MPTDEAMWARCNAMPANNDIEYADALLYVIDINDQLAEAVGVDLVSAAAAVVDSAAAVEVMRELGITGRAYVKTIYGKPHLVLKGYSDLRPNLKLTKYVLTDPRISKIVVGMPKHLAGGALRMSGLAVIAYTTINVVEHVLSDEDPSMSNLLGNIASDTAKFAIAAGLGFLAGAAVGTVTTVAAGPVIATIIVGIAASIILDRIDRQFGLTDKLIEAMEKASWELTRAVEKIDTPFHWLARELDAWEEYYMEKAINFQIYRLRE